MADREQARRGAADKPGDTQPRELPTIGTPQFRDLLRRYRLDAGLTQEELAERATLSVRAISDLERGARTRPQRETVDLLANALGLGPRERERLLASRAPSRDMPNPTPHALDPLPSSPDTLPTAPTPLIGRERALAAATEQLRGSDCRLLTIIGPGGVGKSRLALAVAAALRDHYPDGIAFVPLAAIADPALVATAIAAALGLVGQGARSPRAALVEGLRSRRTLLLLDNFEHLLPARELLDALLAACPGLRVLATSRAPLRSPWEREFPLPPLALPAPGATDPAALATVPAVAVFVARVAVVRPAFALTPENAATVAAICARLDGLPLALELAAARLRLLSPHGLLARLDEPGRFLRVVASDDPGTPARQRTMRAAIAWSYDLLDADEQRLFRALAVAAGGCTLDAAEALVAPWSAADGRDPLDCAESLLLHSLAVREDGPTGEPRLALLETIREFAAETLAAGGETEGVRRAHATYYLALATTLEGPLYGSDPRDALRQIDRDHDNLRAALRWAIATGEAAIGLPLGAILWGYWYDRGLIDEGRRWLDALLALPAGDTLNAARAGVLHGAAALAYAQDDSARALTLIEEALALRRARGDRALLATSLNIRAVAQQGLRDYAGAIETHEEGLRLKRDLGDRRGMAITLNNLGSLTSDRGDFRRALAFYEECLALKRANGERAGLALTLNNLGEVLHYRGEWARQRAAHREALAIYRELAIPRGLASSYGHLGVFAQARGNLARAAVFYAASLERWRGLGARGNCAQLLTNLGALAFLRSDHARAIALHEEALTLAREVDEPWTIANALGGVGEVALARDDAGQAIMHHEAALALFRRNERGAGIALALRNLGRAALATGDAARARTLCRESLARCRAMGDCTGIPPSLEALAATYAATRPARAARLLALAAALRGRYCLPRPPAKHPA